MTDLERYIAQNLPDHLKEASPPEGFDDGEFAESRKVARDAEVKRITGVWHAQLALGWHASELLGESGSAVLKQHMDGTPVRQIARIPAGLRRDARQAVAELHRRNIKLESLAQNSLEIAAYMPDCGSPESVEELTKMAQALIRQHDSQAEREQKVEQKMPELTVFQKVRVIGGREYAVGVHRITPQEAGDLEIWLERMEGQLKGRTADSLGFHIWPPFRIDRMPMDGEQVTAAPKHAPWGPRS